MFKRPLDLWLWALFVVSAGGILLAHEDPFARNWLYANVWCPDWPHSKAWLKVIYDLAVASTVSLIFYALVVRLPEHQRRKRIKRSFASRYRQFKEVCISSILTIADGSYDGDLPESLVNQEKFRAYFSEKVSHSQTRWDTFLNNLNDDNLRELLTSLDIFRDEILFVLGSVDVSDRKPFEFLKALSAAIRSMRSTKAGYDETKPLGNFLWEMFAGWSLVTGYRKADMIKEMIDSI